MRGKENSLLGGFPISGKPSSRVCNGGIGQRSFFIIFFSAFCSITFFCIAYFTFTHGGELSSFGELLHVAPPPPLSIQSSNDYNRATCGRLDSPFEFESPPDFTKLGIETWTECQQVKAKDGWKVEHCTAPGSTWMSTPAGEMLEDFDETNRFLFRPEPRPEGQPYIYTSPPKVHEIPLGSPNQTAPSVCNPGGYFRVQRLSTPSTNYTLGSDSQLPGSRCRNNPGRPISLNGTTKDYVDNFAGPDTFRAVIDGPEHYVANQNINLGNCTYAIPYVLSRPGRFWLVNIEHGFEDFRGLNENFDETFLPSFLGDMILPEVEFPPPKKGIMDYMKYKQAVSQVHEFGVCTGCEQFKEPSSMKKYEDWPVCSRAPLSGAREYGVLVRQSPTHHYGDLFNHDLEWIGSRPLCRHAPRLLTFDIPEAIQKPNGPESRTVRLYGSPPPVPSNLAEQRKITTECLSRNRSIYFVGDSHDRFLYVSTLARIAGHAAADDITGWDTHEKQVGSVSIRQEFESFLQNLYSRAKYLLDPAYVPFQGNSQGLDYLEKVDTMVFDFGAWAAAGFGVGVMWNTHQYIEYISTVLWALAEVRHLRKKLFKETGYGYPDLTIVWMGSAPWPDKNLVDMRTNTRLQYWDDLVNAEIEKINRHYENEGGMIDHLNIYDKFLPFRKLSPDYAHHAAKEPADAAVQVLLHKIDICRDVFTPKFPPPPPPPPSPSRSTSLVATITTT